LEGLDNNSKLELAAMFPQGVYHEISLRLFSSLAPLPVSLPGLTPLRPTRTADIRVELALVLPYISCSGDTISTETCGRRDG
jgi:hypothetical protein